METDKYDSSRAGSLAGRLSVQPPPNPERASPKLEGSNSIVVDEGSEMAMGLPSLGQSSAGMSEGLPGGWDQQKRGPENGQLRDERRKMENAMRKMERIELQIPDSTRWPAARCLAAFSFAWALPSQV